MPEALEEFFHGVWFWWVFGGVVAVSIFCRLTVERLTAALEHVKMRGEDPLWLHVYERMAKMWIFYTAIFLLSGTARLVFGHG